MHFMINTKQNWQKAVVFAPTGPYFGPTNSPHDGGNFKKLSGNSWEVWFISIRPFINYAIN